MKGGEERRRAGGGGGEENESRRMSGGGGRREEGVKWPAPPILKFVGGKLSSGAPRHGCATAIFFLFLKFFHQNLKPEKSPVSVFQLTNPFFLQTAVGG